MGCGPEGLANKGPGCPVGLVTALTAVYRSPSPPWMRPSDPAAWGTQLSPNPPVALDPAEDPNPLLTPLAALILPFSHLCSCFGVGVGGRNLFPSPRA